MIGAGWRDLYWSPPLWAKHEESRHDDDAIPWGSYRVARAPPCEITMRIPRSLRHAAKGRSPRSRLQRYRLDCTRGLHRRFSIRSHGGTVNGAVSSFLAIYIGIANSGDLRFCGPRLFQPVQIREDGGFQLHELFSFFEVVKTFLALFESSAALAFSRSLAVALGSWSGD